MDVSKKIGLIATGFLLVFGCTNTETISTLTETNDPQTQSQRIDPLSPEEELAGFTVPEGFVIELIASEEEGIINPIDLTFDDQGRLWVQTAKMYPLDPIGDLAWGALLKLMNDPEAHKNDPNFRRVSDLYTGITKGDDQILIISDLYDKGKPQVKVWAEGLAIPQSILPYKNGAYVAQGSEMFFLEDTDEDGKADKRTPLFTGFGFTDTHTMAHQLIRGPGGWIHFSHGALNKGMVTSLISKQEVRMDYSKIARFTQDGKKMELVNSGLNNIWGFQLRGNGQWYGSEANDLGYSVVPMESGTGYPGIGSDRLRSYQPWMPELYSYRVGGTGISSMVFTDDVEGSFPKEFKNVAFLANPITSTINIVRVNRNPDGTVSGEHILPDFLTSKDRWFRPVNMVFGPDGALYIADWYNKIVSHNELPTTHPDRDRSHGRIWRVRHKSQKKVEIPNLYQVPTTGLVAHLSAPSLWEKRAAWHQIEERPQAETAKLSEDLIFLAKSPKSDSNTKIIALWSLESINHADISLFQFLLSSSDDDLKREVIRSLPSFKLSIEEILPMLKPLAGSNNPMIRSQIIRTLEELNEINPEAIALLIEFCKPELPGNEMGGSYERRFERFLARKALEKHNLVLQSYLSSKEATTHDPKNIIWASQALPSKLERERIFLSNWIKANYQEFDASTFVVVAGMLDNPSIKNAVKPVFINSKIAKHHVSVALGQISEVQSEVLAQLLEPAVKTLLSSDLQDEQQIGLKATRQLRIKNVDNHLVALSKSTNNQEIQFAVLTILEGNPQNYEVYFSDVAQNKSLPAANRALALRALAKVNQAKSFNLLEGWLPSLATQDVQLVTGILVGTEPSAINLRRLFQTKALEVQAFSSATAERIYNLDTLNPTGKLLIAQVNERIAEDKASFTTKLKHYTAIAEKSEGDPKMGKAIFQTCLACHRVGGDGQNIAPALDGSASRDNEALLTALLDPDAAVESNYTVFKVMLKNGSSQEGYLVQKDEKGTTLAFMGGNTNFISTNDIASQGFAGGRSFMIAGVLDNLTDKEVGDLLAYIKTLN